MTDEQHAAFLRGFNLARPPGPDDADALEVAEEIARSVPGQLRVSVPKDVGRAFLAELDALPEHLTGAIWRGFLRGMIAQAGGGPVHVHEEGRA
ncbi:MAG: hypothetical protein V3R72_09810 [Gammaproteobacteria bacterium]